MDAPTRRGRAPVTLLDGPRWTELAARGVPTPLPGWSAHALLGAPDVVGAIHADYAAAGATVHTTNTFRTRPAVFGDAWREAAERAVAIARAAVPAGHRVAGSIAPLADCYRPDLSPAGSDPHGTRAAHRDLADVLAGAGCDLLLCETFPHVAEAWLALEAAVETGAEAWVSFTPGPACDLLSPAEVADGAVGAVERGARAVLVNCLPADRALPYVVALVRACEGRGVAIGAYANAGQPDASDGWRPAPCDSAAYAAHALSWIAAGATIVGGCCGTGPRHVAAVSARDAPRG